MENTAQPDRELEKHEENQPPAPSIQQPEPETPESQNDPKDRMKKLQDELTEAKDKYLRLVIIK